MRTGASFDVLVVGSGAAGLAAAVSAERAGARVGIATKTTLQACNSAKAQGGIQAAFGEDDSPEIHAEDVMRSLARDGEPEARRGADERGAVGDPLARGARRRVHSVERRLSPRALRRSNATSPAPGRRPHGSRDHEGTARDVRGGRRRRAPSPRAARARAFGRAAGPRPSRRRRVRSTSRRRRSSSRPADGASRRRRRAASSRRTTRTRPAR